MMDTLSMRPYDGQRDAEAVLLLHVTTEEALGGPMDLPDLDARPVLECWVVEKDGIVIGGYYMEAVAEFVMFGRDPEATAFIQTKTAEIALRLRARGLHVCRTMVPNWLGKEVDAITEELETAGFQPTDGYYRHFVYHLRGPAAVTPVALEKASAVARCVE